MTMLQNLNRRFGARKDVLGADKGATSAEKVCPHTRFRPERYHLLCARRVHEKVPQVQIKLHSVRIRFSHLKFDCFSHKLFVC